MNTRSELQFWDIWYPKAGATGVSFARGLLDPTETLLVHAPPPTLTVEVRNESGERLAFASDLEQTTDSPIARLTISGKDVTREDLWPTGDDVGQLVILPGGEVGKLVSWWHADDKSEWRWHVEFYNQK